MKRQLLTLISTICIFISVKASVSSNQGVVYLPVRSIPHQLVPGKLLYATDAHIFRQVTIGLFGVGDGFRIDQHLAKEVSWSNSGRVLRITLGEHYMSDGSPITASDVIASLKRCFSNESRSFVVAENSVEGLTEYIEGKADKISGLKEIDHKTIEITLKKRTPLLLDELSRAECNIIKASKNGSLDIVKGAITSGPYKFEAIDGSDLILTKNPHYRLPMDGPDKVVFRETPDVGDFEKIKSWATMAIVSSQQKAPNGFRGYFFSDLGTIKLILNHSRKPFADLAVRKALSQAIDYAAWANSVSVPLDRIQAGLIPLGMLGFTRRDASQIEKNRAEALRTFKKLGYTAKNPLRFRISYTSPSVMESEIKAWHDALRDMPVKVEFEFIGPRDIRARMQNSDFEALRVTKYPGSVEPHRLLTTYLTNSSHNLSKLRDKKCDDIIKAAVEVEELTHRYQAYQNADRCLMELVVAIPLVSLPPSTVMLKNPWRLKRSNQYLLFPYWASEWTK